MHCHSMTYKSCLKNSFFGLIYYIKDPNQIFVTLKLIFSHIKSIFTTKIIYFQTTKNYFKFWKTWNFTLHPFKYKIFHQFWSISTQEWIPQKPSTPKGIFHYIFTLLGSSSLFLYWFILYGFSAWLTSWQAVTHVMHFITICWCWMLHWCFNSFSSATNRAL